MGDIEKVMVVNQTDKAASAYICTHLSYRAKIWREHDPHFDNSVFHGQHL